MNIKGSILYSAVAGFSAGVAAGLLIAASTRGGASATVTLWATLAIAFGATAVYALVRASQAMVK